MADDLPVDFDTAKRLVLNHTRPRPKNPDGGGGHQARWTAATGRASSRRSLERARLIAHHEAEVLRHQRTIAGLRR